jgi:hypothetical protein
MPALTSIALGIGGISALAAGASAFGKKDPKFDPTGELSKMQMGAQGQLGSAGQNAATGALGNLANLRNDASFGANRDLASMLQQYSQGGYLPNEQDNSTAQSFAQSQFNPQRVAMQQAFQDQLTQANRQAALSGRGMNDPILRAKLAQEQTRQQSQLEAQQGAFASNFALQQPMQRLQFAEGRANVLTQDMARRQGLEQTIFGSGMQAQAQDYSQRANQYQMDLSKVLSQVQGKFQQDANETTFLQRLGSTISGGVSGIGAGMSAAPALSSLFGGGAAAGGALGSAPAAGGMFRTSASSMPSFGFGNLTNTSASTLMSGLFQDRPGLGGGSSGTPYSPEYLQKVGFKY